MAFLFIRSHTHPSMCSFFFYVGTVRVVVMVAVAIILYTVSISDRLKNLISGNLSRAFGFFLPFFSEREEKRGTS